MDTTKLEHVIQDAISEAMEEERQAIISGKPCFAFAALSSVLAYAHEKVGGLLEDAHREEYGRL